MEPALGPEPIPVPEDVVAIVQSMRTTAARHAEEIREIVELERKQMASERAELVAERGGMMEEFRQEHARLDEERQARITELETELAQVKADLEAERALRISEEADRRERERLEDSERHEGVRVQLGDIMNLVQAQRDECTRKKELMDERWNKKMNRRLEKDGQSGNLYDMVTRIVEDRKIERIAAESRPGIEFVIKELARQNAEHRELLVQIAESWKSDFARHRGEASATIYEPSGDQVPGGCLCRATTYTFSKAPQNPPEDFNWEANYVVPGGKDGNNKWAASHCYCDSCRVSVGTLVATWFSVPRSQFRLRRKGSTTVYRSSSHATREFCSTCGTSLFFHDANEPEFIDITLASVSVNDLSEYVQVTAHIWLGDAEEQTLRSKGEGLGLAAVINDGLSRWRRGRDSERL